ncbi:MAG TPA: ATP-binding protein [Telluria sp.]|nr:ATP-binding protein [Telluria sp.]
MRISIGHRLFAAVLLAILAVTASGIALMRHKVLGSFADYAMQIELDRLDELAASLGRQHTALGDWSFVPAGAALRRDWIATELLRLEQNRKLPAPPAPPAAPRPPAAPSPSSSRPAAVAPMARLPVAERKAAANAVQPPSPPRAPAPFAVTPPEPPPAPDVPELPPLPPPPVAPRLLSDGPAAEASAPLQDRIALYDATGRYVAGREAGSAPSVRRPVIAGGQTVGFLTVARPLRPGDALALAFLGQLKDSVLLIVAMSVALSALAAMLLAAHFRKPVLRLAQGTRELAAGRFDTRLDIARSDELGELAGHFNQLAERLESAERMRRDWVADTSHELRTPVSVLRAQIEAMLDGVRPATRENIEVLARQVMSLNKLIDELNVLARLDVGELEYRKEPVDAWALLAAEAQAFGEKLDAAGLALSLGPAPADATLLADPDRLRQVFDNLLENSVRYTSAGGKVELTAAVQGARLLLQFDDSAPGVPAEAMDRLTERFYRVDASRSRKGGGSGLGLALCERIVQAHGGTLSFAHSPLGGLRACLDLPLAKEAA